MAEAIDLVRKKRDEHGHWPLENSYPGRVHFEIDLGGHPKPPINRHLKTGN
jgi:hypothetical protein